METMEKNRLAFHEVLVELLGSRNVYFQPPESLKLKYPCIVYERSAIDNLHGSNKTYVQFHGYQVTVIDKDPDSAIVDKVSKFDKTKFSRHFASDGLNHDIFTIYY